MGGGVAASENRYTDARIKLLNCLSSFSGLLVIQSVASINLGRESTWTTFTAASFNAFRFVTFSFNHFSVSFSLFWWSHQNAITDEKVVAGDYLERGLRWFGLSLQSTCLGQGVPFLQWSYLKSFLSMMATLSEVTTSLKLLTSYQIIWVVLFWFFVGSGSEVAYVYGIVRSSLTSHPPLPFELVWKGCWSFREETVTILPLGFLCLHCCYR